MAFPPLLNTGHVAVSVSIDLPSNSQWDALFDCIAYEYSRVDCNGLCDHLKDVPWEDIFKLGASAVASEFCEWVQVGIYPSKKISGKASLISMVFSCLCCCHSSYRSFFSFVPIE